MIKEINKEILRLYHSTKEKLFVQQDGDKVYITDSYVAWIINEKDFIFDASKFKNVDIKHLVDGLLNNELADASILHRELKDKLVIATVGNDDTKVKINDKYLKCFPKNCTFKIVNDTSPILVYEQDVLLGIICPTRRI